MGIVLFGPGIALESGEVKLTYFFLLLLTFNFAHQIFNFQKEIFSFFILVTNFPMWTSTLVVAVAAVIYTSIVSASYFI